MWEYFKPYRWQRFLRIQNVQAIIENKNPIKFEIIKIKNICSSKGIIITKMNRQEKNLEENTQNAFLTNKLYQETESTPKNQ